jgi:CRISPR-associated protein Cmr1
MIQREYAVQFATPAFLGNAEQNGQWRTPPFKALLRQWWRVAYAADRRFDVPVDEMRREEGRLFGVAADGREGSSRSLVRLRLDRWDLGKQRDWRGLDSERVVHPEVTDRDGRPTPVGAHLYLGYGPLIFADRQTALKARAAIQAGESASLSLAFPTEHADPGLNRLLGDNAPRIEHALGLMDRYGVLGGRSRNGWGSFSLSFVAPGDGGEDLSVGDVVRPWRDALALDWPHAIGRDEQGPLVWKTENVFQDWKPLMRRLAEIKIGLRTQFRFNSGRNAAHPEERHWLSYPVTNHSVRPWGNNARLPNSLRFKVRPDPDGKLRGLIFHCPCSPPAQFHPDRRVIEAVWQRVHAFLDHPSQDLRRAPQ